MKRSRSETGVVGIERVSEAVEGAEVVDVEGCAIVRDEAYYSGLARNSCPPRTMLERGDLVE